MAESYKGLQSRAIGTTRTKVGGYNVPASTAGVIVGLALANVRDTRDVKATVEIFDGTNYTVLRKNKNVGLGEAVKLADFSDQLVLPTGYSLHVTADYADAIDVVMSVREIS